MATVFATGTLADLITDLGVSPQRILFPPAPGTASESDLLAVNAREDRLVELVDGVLVEKAVGFEESLLAAALVEALRRYVIPRKLGVVVGSDGMVRLGENTVRMADAAYVPWARFPEGRLTGDPIPQVAPAIAAEVLSESNTEAEMRRKRGEYFAAGVKLVWLIDHRTRTVRVYTGPEECRTLGEADSLDGGDVLPDFTLPLKDLLGELA